MQGLCYCALPNRYIWTSTFLCLWGYIEEGLQSVMFSWNTTVFQTREKSKHPQFAEEHRWLIGATSRTPLFLNECFLWKIMCALTYVCTFPRVFWKKHKILSVKPENLKNVHQPVIPKERDFLPQVTTLQHSSTFMWHEQRWTATVRCSHHHKKNPTSYLFLIPHYQ